MIISELTVTHLCLDTSSNAGFVLTSPETGPGASSEDMLVENVVAIESQSHDLLYQLMQRILYTIPYIQLRSLGTMCNLAAKKFQIQNLL